MRQYMLKFLERVCHIYEAIVVMITVTVLCLKVVVSPLIPVCFPSAGVHIIPLLLAGNAFILPR